MNTLLSKYWITNT